MTAPLTPDRMRPLFRSSFGQTYRHLTRAASTQDEFLEADPEGSIVACEEQWAGRGRRGQAWLAPRGSALLASILLRPGSRQPAAQISLVAGVLVAALVQRELGQATGIKWPNDVLVGRAKVAGVLAEQRGGAIALGIGLNVNQTDDELPTDTPLRATSLRVADGRIRDRAPLLAAIAEGLETTYRAWQRSGLEAIAGELAERDVLRGQRVKVDSLDGVAAGIGEDGALLLHTDAGQRSVVAGNIEVSW